MISLNFSRTEKQVTDWCYAQKVDTSLVPLLMPIIYKAVLRHLRFDLMSYASSQWEVLKNDKSLTQWKRGYVEGQMTFCDELGEKIGFLLQKKEEAIL